MKTTAIYKCIKNISIRFLQGQEYELLCVDENNNHKYRFRNAEGDSDGVTQGQLDRYFELVRTEPMSEHGNIYKCLDDSFQYFTYGKEYTVVGTKETSGRLYFNMLNNRGGTTKITSSTIAECFEKVKTADPNPHCNLILKKALPTIMTDDTHEKYPHPKGTVYGWNEKEERYQLVLNDPESPYIIEEEIKLNPKFFGHTSKPHTYEQYYIDGKKVIFKEDHIEVGCRRIDNELIRKIAAKLIDKPFIF